MQDGGNIIEKLKKLLRLPWIKISSTEYTYVFGSRRVIKDVLNSKQNHYYGVDVWTQIGQTLVDKLPPNTCIYGEIYGYVPNSSTPIQKGYTYDANPGEAKFVAYRVVNHGIDLGDAAAREWCAERGIAFVPKLWEGPKGEFVAEDWMDRRFAKEGYPGAISLAKESPVDEGVVVLVEGLAPKRYKVKGSLFYEFESKILDTAEEVLS